MPDISESGSADIVKEVAERLGWKLWDQLLTNEIARLMGAIAASRKSMKRRRPRCIIGSSRVSCTGAMKAV
jgi:hypothetical protein